MIGAIAGDIIGSRFEAHNYKGKDFELFDRFCHFTDDTVLTCATAQALLTDQDYKKSYQDFYKRYPGRGYGPKFRMWAAGNIPGPYGSFGNGSAMRVSPVAWSFESLTDILTEAECSAKVSHNHPEGIKGAQCLAAAVFLGRTGKSKSEIRDYIVNHFGYNINFTLDSIRPKYRTDLSCQGSVPQAVVAFLESENFTDAIRNAISIGGDSDTIGAMTGAMAEAFYGGVPAEILREVWKYLDDDLQEIVQRFSSKTDSYNLCNRFCPEAND